jgi:hypothetical protein
MFPSRNRPCFAIEISDPRAEIVRIRRRNARVKEGANCLWFVRKNGVQFVGAGEIKSVRRPKEEDAYGPVLEISHDEVFKTPRTLDEMAGSLSRLKEPRKAPRSFARQYVRLDYWDFQRIRVQYVDFERTVFRTLFFALPEALRIEFLHDSIDTFDLGRFPVVDHFGLLADRLLAYLRGPVANVLTMAARIGELNEEIEVRSLPSLESLTLTDSVGEHPIPFGRAALRLQWERGKLLPQRAIRRHTTHRLQDGWDRDEIGLILGLQENFSVMEAEALPDDTLDGSARIIEQLRNRPWRESIL